MSMTSEVMEKRGWVEFPILSRFCGKPIQQGARALFAGKKSFSPEFPQANILSSAESGERRKQAKRRVLPVVIDGQKRWSVIQIEHAPAARHVWIAESFLEETLQHLARRVVCNFTMPASNDTCGNHFPIFDKGPQPMGNYALAAPVCLAWKRHLYSLGATRKTRLKVLRMASQFRKPQVDATDSRRALLSCNRRRAASKRKLSTNFAGVVFISARNTRAKLRGLIPVRDASTSTDRSSRRCSSTHAPRSRNGWRSPVCRFSAALNCD